MLAFLAGAPFMASGLVLAAEAVRDQVKPGEALRLKGFPHPVQSYVLATV